LPFCCPAIEKDFPGGIEKGGFYETPGLCSFLLTIKRKSFLCSRHVTAWDDVKDAGYGKKTYDMSHAK
jgi:hypothetical protein